MKAVPKLRLFTTIYCLASTGFMVALFVFILPYYYGPDSRVYYTAAQAAFQKNIDVIYDPLHLTAFANQLLGPSFSPGFTFATFLYPPIFLLLVVPLGLLSPLGFYVCFELITAGATVLATPWRRNVGSIWQAVAIITSPAGCLNLIQGQNAFLSLGLFTSGVRLLESRPVLAGALFGMLVYKPQHALLVPLALVGARAWRALIAATSMVVLLALLSAALFGTESWTLWLNFVLHPPAYFYDWWFAYGMNNGFSPFVCAIVLGASPTAAMAVQGSVVVAAAAAVLYVFRRSTNFEIRIACLLCAAAISNPHLQGYELVLAASAISFVFRLHSREGFIPGELLLLAVLWAPPVFPPLAFKLGFVVPAGLILLGGLIVVCAARADQRIAQNEEGCPVRS
jgi:hypothetical protein